MAVFRGGASGFSQLRNSDDWYCKTCSDHWGGHYVNRGHRKACFKCGLEKNYVFQGKVKATMPARNGAQPPEGIKAENTKLRAEVAKLKASN